MRLQLSVSLVVSSFLLAAGSARATEYYVAPNGSDSNAGTMAAPWATLQKGVNTAVAGDTVWIRAGTYKVTTPAVSGGGINFNKSGTAAMPIKYWAYPGETPLFDFSNLVISTTGYTMGFTVSGSYLHFKGLEICCVPMNTASNNGISVTAGSNDTFELLNMHHNNGNGIFIGSRSSGGHLILNCDAHDNYDPNSSQGQGQNADGFGVHYQTSGATTIVRGCRAWWNSDDGYDLINQDIPVTVENSWAFMNGYANYGATNPSQGNGNGFKMGSSPMMVRHLVQNNVAWKNKAHGFYANHSPGGNTWYNNTSFMNGSSQYNMLASPPNTPNTTITLSGTLAHIMRNNIGFPNRNMNMTGVDTMFNSWDLSLTPANGDFASVSDPSAPTSGQAMGMAIEGMGAMGPRQADGSLPNIDFMKLAAGSKMIDKGTNVGLPFVGTAPDLGAYEYGATTTTGTGGATGTGGTTGTGGATAGTGGRGGSGAGGTTGSGGRGGTSAGAGTGGGAAGTVGTGGSTSPGTAGAGATGTGGATSGTAGNGTGGASVTGTGGATSGTAGNGTGGASVTGTGGASVTGTGGASVTGTGGASVTGSGGNGPGETASGGCACAIDASGGHAPLFVLAVMGALSSIRVRRRRRRR